LLRYGAHRFQSTSPSRKQEPVDVAEN